MRYKRFIAIALVIILVASCCMSVGASELTLSNLFHRQVTSYDVNVDYIQAMRVCATMGTVRALRLGSIYEQQRNLMIDSLNLEMRKTAYFSTYTTGGQILFAMNVDRMKEEHYIAAYVYERLRKAGLSDIVVAGILGNMMAECGGQTLDLQWWIYGGNNRYYGLCMWDVYYGPNVKGVSAPAQVDYLLSTLKKHIEQFGGNYEEFLSMSDAGQAARFFNSYYERGAGAKTRANNAKKALAWIYDVDKQG